MKKYIYTYLIGVVFLVILTGSSVSFNPNQVIGKWKSANNKQIVNVYFDSSKSCYTGKVSWMAEDDPTKGTKLCDVKNPNPSLRNRRLTGIDLLYNFTFKGNRIYYGRVYDPISGKNYKCKITLSKDSKTAYIRGYKIVPALGRTEVSTRIAE